MHSIKSSVGIDEKREKELLPFSVDDSTYFQVDFSCAHCDVSQHCPVGKFLVSVCLCERYIGIAALLISLPSFNHV